jgi:hypothetical protein
VFVRVTKDVITIGNIMTGNMEYIYNMEGVVDKLNMR